jgi:hypothetical protein
MENTLQILTIAGCNSKWLTRSVDLARSVWVDEVEDVAGPVLIEGGEHDNNSLQVVKQGETYPSLMSGRRIVTCSLAVGTERQKYYEFCDEIFSWCYFSPVT